MSALPTEMIEESARRSNTEVAGLLPVSVIVPVRNESHNLPRCLDSLKCAAEVYVIDSNSTDSSVEIAHEHGAKVVQFHYRGGWPKKRQWAMDSVPLAHDWILLIDADETMTGEMQAEIGQAVLDPKINGYYITLQMFFLGRVLRHSGASFDKLSLFRRGKGKFECRLKDQDTSMCDMEVHEHVIVEGATGRLKHPLIHHNVESLTRYIQKHDEYSNWEAKVWMQGEAGIGDLPPALLGTQAQRRRWLRKKFFRLPGSPVLFFLYKYVFRLGFLDGIPGLVYCVMQGVQFFHIKAKIYELRAKGN